MLSGALPLLRLIYASISPRSRFSLMEVHAVFVVGRVKIRQVFLRLLLFHPVFITPEMMGYHSPIYYLPHLILAVDSSVEYHS